MLLISMYSAHTKFYSFAHFESSADLNVSDVRNCSATWLSLFFGTVATNLPSTV